MKIRLKVTPPGGRPDVFEYPGPVVRIGRDEGCELRLEGEAATASSRQHARIDLSEQAARLTDLGSANKTQCNDAVVTGPTGLKVGDRIQIGFTGSQIVVLELDLTTPPPPKWPVKPGHLAAGGLGVAAFVAVAAAVALWPRRPAAEPDRPVPPPPAPAVPTAPPAPVTPVAVAPPPAPVPVPVAVVAPPAEARRLGYYLQPKEGRASVLMQRAAEGHPWAALRSGQAVPTGHTLVSLPGYESLIALDGGVRLNLWGGLPELGSPVAESVVTLNVPEKGLDADLILDRGRVEISTVRPKGCKARVRFLGEAWDVTLNGPDSRACVELLHRVADSAGEDARCVGVFCVGGVAVRAAAREVTFPGPGRLAWLNTRPDDLFEEKLAAPPDWWGKPPALKAEGEEALLALKEWAGKGLEGVTDVVDAFRKAAADSSEDEKTRVLALWFLAAVDEAPLLAGFLSDQAPNGAAIRATAGLCLQNWLGRNGPLAGHLSRHLQQRQGYARETADLIVRLLRPVAPAEQRKAATYQELIGLLDHDDVAVRHLSYWQLTEGLADRMPDAVYKIEYAPTLPRGKRQEAVVKWRGEILATAVPSRPKRDG